LILAVDGIKVNDSNPFIPYRAIPVFLPVPSESIETTENVYSLGNRNKHFPLL